MLLAGGCVLSRSVCYCKLVNVVMVRFRVFGKKVVSGRLECVLMAVVCVVSRNLCSRRICVVGKIES